MYSFALCGTIDAMKSSCLFALALFVASGSAVAKGSHSSSHHSSSTKSHTSKACCSTSRSDEHVRGYTKKDGTHVDGYMKTAPNSTEKDNFSTRGNTNPYTGKEGTKEPKK